MPGHGYASFLKRLGPGLLWAGAAIGVSHLVQSTRAGAIYGFSLIWLVLLANLLKYPFFEFGPRYAAATGETLMDGYLRMGRWALYLFLALTFATMFTVQAAVTVVTAGILSWVLEIGLSPFQWSAVLLLGCAVMLWLGRYALLDKLIKVIIVVLSVSTLAALVAASFNGIHPPALNFQEPDLWSVGGVAFMVALMGWMPSAIDISVWSSVWTLEHRKITGKAPSLQEALLDFNVGYFGTVIIALCFLGLGALVMYGSPYSFSPKGTEFAAQFFSLYTESLGSWSLWLIVLAAFATMFSTTLTCLDAFPRVLRHATTLVFPRLKGGEGRLYWIWLIVVLVGALMLLKMGSTMAVMVDFATTISFLTAPVLAWLNFKVVTSSEMPEESRPGLALRVLARIGVIFLTGFSLFFLYRRFIQ